ncbi:DUF4350 domain-containing protein [Nesterenkonia sphaerica]|uniref:DUF4350 domain-containing protein n=1 Tax=Nesterenkonia sphaerica TaxID=1804988 RepID=A0A5R9A522_9MICC|nr:DUF4350 domain-containing protein [Nesterenkonia sphaerica]TLP73284.1 hypothetical protein FEF27_10290 [Nesterenkonia sphaerica]
MSAQTGSPTVAPAAAAVRTAATRWQFWIVLAVVAAAVALVAQLLETSETEVFGTENTDLDGYAAVASVLEDHGVELHRVYSAQAARELMEQNPGAGVVVLLRDIPPEERFTDELEAEVEAGREVLWISAETWLIGEVFGAEAQAGPRIGEGAAGTAQVLHSGPRCPHPAAETASSLQAPGGSLHAERGCFPVDHDSYVLSETTHGLVFTAPEAFTNQHITAEGNAALALGLLGAAAENEAEQTLIWYTPSGTDQVGAQQWGSPLDYLPAWFWPLLWWLMICAAIGLVAAGRRYGPVVSEPMPVTVPAEEAVVGRGRLYQRANAVAATNQVLRSAHLLRLSRLLGLGRGASPEAIAAAASHTAQWDLDAVRRLLEGPASEHALSPNQHAARPRDTDSPSDMVARADALAKLERDVRDALRTQRRTE